MGGTVAYHALAPTAWLGWVGVEVFFVISGFVIAFSATGKTAGQFLLSRFLRLYPAVWVCAPITAFVLLILGSGDVGEKLIRSMTLFPFGPWVDAVYWTLGIEMAFYGLVLLLILSHQHHRLLFLAWGLVAVSGAVWVLWLALPDSPPWLKFLLRSRYANLGLLTYGGLFAMGIFLWRLTQKRCLASVVGAGAGGIIGAIEIYQLAIAKASGYSPLIPVFVWLVCISLIVASISMPMIDRLLAPMASSVRTIGLATFPLYLLHDVIGASVIRALREMSVAPYVALSAGILSAILLSFAVLLPERAVRTRLQSVLARSRRRETA